MSIQKATANAGSNIAFIKYWGTADSSLNLPLSDNISMTLADMRTITTVIFDSALAADEVIIGGKQERGDPLRRASRHLDRLRDVAGVTTRAQVISKNNFPMAAGIASSASAFAALTVAGCAALGLELDARHLSRLARRESGSASRSLFGGFVEWYAGHDDESSYAAPIASQEHWSELRDVVAIVDQERKKVSSAEGHLLAATSPFLEARIVSVRTLLPDVRHAILTRNLRQLGPLIEADALAMHFVMMSSSPRLFYWTPTTLELIRKCQTWREEGVEAYFTIDAGPNVHFICERKDEEALCEQLRQVEGVKRIMSSEVGSGPFLMDEHLEYI